MIKEKIEKEIEEFKKIEEDVFNQVDRLMDKLVTPRIIICDAEGYHNLRKLLRYWDLYRRLDAENSIKLTLTTPEPNLPHPKRILIYSTPLTIIQRIDFKGILVMGSVDE